MDNYAYAVIIETEEEVPVITKEQIEQFKKDLRHIKIDGITSICLQMPEEEEPRWIVKTPPEVADQLAQMDIDNDFTEEVRQIIEGHNKERGNV